MCIRDSVLDNCPDEIAFFNAFGDKGLKERLEHVASSDFGRVSYTDAGKILEEAVAAGHEFEYPVYWGCDLATEHERFLTEEVYKRPVFVTEDVYKRQIYASVVTSPVS